MVKRTPLLNGRDAYDRHHVRRAAEGGYFTAILHLGRGRRFREEHRTLDDAIAAARRLAAQGDGRPAAVYAVSPEPGHPSIHVTNVGPG